MNTEQLKDYERLKNENAKLAQEVSRLKSRLMEKTYENIKIRNTAKELAFQVEVKTETIKNYKEAVERFNKKVYIERVFNPYLKLL